MKTYFVLNNVPGTDITSESSKTAVVVLNVVHIASVFTFAVLVGVLADDISGAVENARQGNWKVPVARHTLILGWNSTHTPLLINQVGGNSTYFE